MKYRIKKTANAHGRQVYTVQNRRWCIWRSIHTFDSLNGAKFFLKGKMTEVITYIYEL